ncbi:MAG: major facilitator transporter [Candidatus Peregrinibacteria bacterium GW2011_GWF2_43_17]|nr:MAG: major facilitator transporter [Candidatus Peregrinibacteria bacterium GW2011_GWF2_43_17]KKT18662.1 MAG: multidrug resistance efflux pump [Candidatus Peregrinibacteria bacterium GW2011_GWA2_43_8]HAU40125.1 hypothetical protein [Candidatus Peregrinibacteria bacterium]
MFQFVKYKTPKLTSRGRVFSYMIFFYCLAVAIVSPIFPGYLEDVSRSEFYVGLFVAVSSLMTFLGSLLVPKFLHKYSRMLLLYAGFLGMALVFMMYFFASGFYPVLFLQFVKGFAIAILLVVIPLMVKDYTDEDKLSKEEGVYYWFMNIAWIIGPILGGLLSLKFDQRFLFLFSMVVFVCAAFFLQHKKVSLIADKVNNVTRLPLIYGIKQFWTRKQLRKAYLVDFGLYFWWAISTISVPLYMLLYDFNDFYIGIVMALTLVPLVVLEKWVGEHVKNGNMGANIRKGFLIMVLALMATFIFKNVYFSIAMFVVVSIGAAFVEPVKETYLFMHLGKHEEADLFPIYSTARQLGYFVGPIFGGIVAVLFGYEILFLVTGFALLPMVFVGHLIHKE